MQAKDFQDLIGASAESMKSAKEIIGAQMPILNKLESQILQNRDKVSDAEMSKFEKDLEKVRKLKKELDGFKNNR